MNNWRGLSDRGVALIRELVLEMSRAAFKQFLHTVHDRLIDYAQKPSEGEQGFEFLHARSQISARHNEISRCFLRSLDEAFDRFSAPEPGRHLAGSMAGEERRPLHPSSHRDMALMGDEDVEEDLALSSIRKRAEVENVEVLWSLAQRMALLASGKKVEEDNLPLAPGAFCEALKRSLAITDIQLAARLVIYKLFDRLFIPQLDDLYMQANGKLIELGVLPNLSYQVEKAKEGDSARFTGAEPRRRSARTQAQQIPVLQEIVAADGYAVTPPSRELPSREYQNQLLDSIQLLQRRLVSSVSTERVALAGQPLQYTERQLVEAVVQLQHYEQAMAADFLAAANQIKPLDIARARSTLVDQLKQITHATETPAMGGDDIRTIDLVGMLFEYILNDEQIPDCVKALLSYLHTPFLKLAFTETDFFRHQEHPARLLLNVLADAGSQWVSNDGSCQFDMLEQIRVTVRQVLDAPDVETRLFASLLMAFNGYVQKVEVRIKLLEKRAMERARGEDRLIEVKQRVNRELRQRIADRNIPSAMLLFFLQPWTDYMVHILLRHGEESESWRQSISLVEDMLWGLELSGSAGEWLRWRQHYLWIESMIQCGFDMIGYASDKALKLKRSIDRIYQLRERNLKPEPAPEDLRNKLVRLAERRAGERADISQLGDREKTVIEKLKLMEFGTWFEYRDGRREKVAWFNPNSLQFLFVDQAGKRSGMKTGNELAKAIVCGELRMLDAGTKPLVERTMESIFGDLNERARAAAGAQRHVI
ncbi:MAG: DUF1631 family protein [Porticoccaceae bacterium]